MTIRIDLDILMVRSNLLSGVLGKEFMELVEDLGAKVDKCSYINENINVFCNIGQDHPSTFNL